MIQYELINCFHAQSTSEYSHSNTLNYFTICLQGNIQDKSFFVISISYVSTYAITIIIYVRLLSFYHPTSVEFGWFSLGLVTLLCLTGFCENPHVKSHHIKCSKNTWFHMISHVQNMWKCHVKSYDFPHVKSCGFSAKALSACSIWWTPATVQVTVLLHSSPFHLDFLPPSVTALFHLTGLTAPSEPDHKGRDAH